MRYHYEKPDTYLSMYGSTYNCNNPVYNKCTLFKIRNKGLAVIQQRYDLETKKTWWGEIDPWLTDTIYLHPKFREYFDKRAGECMDGLYPTVTIRQLMWSFKLKPIPRERWETCFDRRHIWPQFAYPTSPIMETTKGELGDGWIEIEAIY